MPKVVPHNRSHQVSRATPNVLIPHLVNIPPGEFMQGYTNIPIPANLSSVAALFPAGDYDEQPYHLSRIQKSFYVSAFAGQKNGDPCGAPSAAMIHQIGEIHVSTHATHQAVLQRIAVPRSAFHGGARSMHPANSSTRSGIFQKIGQFLKVHFVVTGLHALPHELRHHLH